MKPANSFTDESIMATHGEPIEYVPAFIRPLAVGLEVREITIEEWEAEKFKIQGER